MANTCMRSPLPRCPWCGRILPSIMQSNSLSPAHIHSLLHPSIQSLMHQIFIDYLLYARYAWKSLSRVQLFATAWNSPGQNTGVGLPCPPPGNLPNPGIEPRSPTLQADSLPSEPPGRPNGFFPTQGSNPGLPHCQWIPCHLSHQSLRQEYWSGLPCPSLGDLPDPGIRPTSPALVDGFFATELPGMPFFKLK